jgi:putative tryptophan/tyrosine transport system substrate-binding protein
LRLRLLPVVWRGADDLERTFSEINKAGASSLVVLSGFATHRAQIVALAAKYRLPTVYSDSEYPEAGGLISYGTSISERYRRVAHYVDRILKGAKPADMPIETPTKFELVVNLGTAKQLGLIIPESVLQRADRVIR